MELNCNRSFLSQGPSHNVNQGLNLAGFHGVSNPPLEVWYLAFLWWDLATNQPHPEAKL